jgi:hypothetical protein
MESYRLMFAGMLSTFVGDLERYWRWRNRQGKKVSACVKNQNENIQMDFHSALQWMKARSDNSCPWMNAAKPAG